MLIWRETGHHLLVWMNVIAEIPESMTELLYVRLQQINLASNVDELSKVPFVETLYGSVTRLVAGRCPIEPRRFLLSRAKQDTFQHASTKKDHRKIRARRYCLSGLGETAFNDWYGLRFNRQLLNIRNREFMIQELVGGLRCLCRLWLSTKP